MRERGAAHRRRAAPRRPPPAAARGGGRRGAASCSLAGRRPLHLPRLPRVPAGRAGRPRRPSLAPVPGTGLGILRYDQQPSSRAASSRLTAAGAGEGARAAAAGAHQGEHPRHRAPAAYLDYIGVKQFDADGEVVGERRFLGLFASAAYTDERPPDPGGPAQGAGGAGPRRASPPTATPARTCCRSWRPTRATSSSRSPSTTCWPPSTAVLHLQERRRTCGCSCAATTTAAYVSCLVYLPRDRYTTAVRLRMEEILLRRLRRRSTVDYTARVSESRAGPAALRRPRSAPARRCRTSTPTTLERRLVEATRSWDEDLADALRAELGEEEAARAAARYGGRGFPEALQGGLHGRAWRSRTCAGSRRSTPAPSRRCHEPLRAGRRRAGRAALQALPTAPLSLSDVLPFLGRPRRRGRRRAPVRAPPRRRRRAPGSTTSGCATPRPAAAPRAAARAVRRRVRRGLERARPRATASTALVLLGGLTWRQVVVLRAYAKYLRQTGTTFSQDYIERRAAHQRRAGAAARAAVRGPVRPRAHGRGTRTRRAPRARPTPCWRRSTPPSTPWRAWTTTASCGRSSP